MRIICISLFTQQELPDYFMESIINETKKNNIDYYSDKIDVMKEDNKTYSIYRYVLNNYNSRDSFDYFLEKFSVVD